MTVGLVVAVSVFAVLAWRRHRALAERVEELAGRITRLSRRVHELEAGGGAATSASRAPAEVAAGVGAVEPEALAPSPPAVPSGLEAVVAAPAAAPVAMEVEVALSRPAGEGALAAPDAPRPATVPPPPPAASPPRERGSLEKNLATRLPIWLGAIALALAGAFLVKYSFDQGWISEQVRVAAAIAFGLLLLAGGEFLRTRSRRIGEALSAAGVADLFAGFLAGIHVYHLIPPAVGMGLMILTTAVAVALSLRQGPIVAVVGLVGGYLTPLLVRTGAPDARKLFAYLLLLEVGLLAVSKRRGWWPIAAASLAGGLLWVLAWLGAPYQAGDGAWLALFLLLSAASAVVAVLGMTRSEGATADGASRPLGPAALGGGALVAMLGALGLVAGRSFYEPVELALFGLLSAGLLIVAHRRSDLEPLGVVAPAIAAILLLVWGADLLEADLRGVPLSRFFAAAGGFGALFALGGYLGLWRARRPGAWGALSATSAVGFFLIAWRSGSRLRPDLHWGGLALALAAVTLVAALPLARRRIARPELSPSLAALAVAVTTFASFAAPLELERPWIAVAWAVEVAALVWLAGRFDLPALRHLARAVAAMVGVRLLLNPAVLGYPIGARPIFNWLLYGYGLPLLAFAGAARLARRRGDDRLGVELEFGAVGFGFALATLEIRQVFHPGALDRGPLVFAELGGYVLAWLGLGLGLLAADRRSARVSLRWPGFAILALGTAASAMPPFFLLDRPSAEVGALPVVNLLLLVFGGASALFAVAVRELSRRSLAPFSAVAGVLSIVSAFLLLTFEVRQAFHGSVLASGATTTAERYAYSAAWIVFGTLLLGLGIARKSRALRWASLAVMMLTVAKVFLYDASNLTGLYRVVSFLGLGASLLLLAFVYQRFVFGRDDAEEAP